MPLNTLRASSSQQLASNVVDTALAALGAAAGLYLLSFLEAAIDQPMYASSLASSAVLIFSGYLLNDASIPVGLVFLKYPSFIRYAFEATMQNQWRGYGAIAWCVRLSICA